MAYALAAFARPRLTLANPGIMAALYPRFWALYNGLPAGPPDDAPSATPANQHEEQEHNDTTRRKRVRLSGVYAGSEGSAGETGN
jgi:hypothetical protein